MVRRQENAVIGALNSVLSERGFTRHKKAWYLSEPETILVVDLQKSNWSSTYYLSFGVLLRQLSQLQKPKLTECHVFQRLESLLEKSEGRKTGQLTLPKSHEENDTFAHQLLTNPLSSITLRLDDPTFFDTTGLKPSAASKALDLQDKTISETDRLALITHALITFGLPFLRKFDSLEKIKKRLRDTDLSTVFVHQGVRELLQ